MKQCRPLRKLSGLRARLLAFNGLVVFLPAAGVLFLDTFEGRLLADQERTMVEQARVLSAALSERGDLTGAEATSLLGRLGGRSVARLRVVGIDGRVLADSSQLGPRREPGEEERSAEPSARDSWLYRLGSAPIQWLQWLRRLTGGGSSVHDSADAVARAGHLDGREIRAALAGRYGAATRISAGGQRSVTLYSAVPIRSGDSIVGAALVSRSTFHILQALYELRAGVLGVCLASFAASVVLSLIVSHTIARPLRRLRDQASQVLRPHAGFAGRFHVGRRSDEIGELAAALERLRGQLAEHIAYMEGFGGDVAHELKNPLASIRGAAEMLGGDLESDERRHFAGMIQRDIARMQRVLADVREMSRIDSATSRDEVEPVDLVDLVAGLAESESARGLGAVAVRTRESKLAVLGTSERLARALGNILDNALGLTPSDEQVDIEIARHGDRAVVRVRDRGPGIPEAHRDRIFARFFSYRPGDASGEHSGLGLAISSAIVADAGGCISARNRADGGSCFEVELPLCSASMA